MAGPQAEIVESGQVPAYGTFHHPDRFLKTAELVASTFKKRADQLQLFKQIGPGKHLLVEGWQMLAAMYHVSASLESDQYVTYGDAFGFEATYIATHVPTGQVISRATAMCLSTEENWGLRPRYEGKGNSRRQVGLEPTPLQQIRSMAQTRAESKALSNLLKWVAKMAGFAVTPYEEMTGNEKTESQQQETRQHQPQQQAGSSSAAISEAQRKRLWAIAKGLNLSNDIVSGIVKKHGFESSDSITRDKYDAIVAEVEAQGSGQ